MRRSISLRVHDEGNQAHVGDTVRVVESRPMSRTKRWRLIEVVEVAR
jgi:small subunit ribosomal protein S17